jgi:hypothetical protein
MKKKETPKMSYLACPYCDGIIHAISLEDFICEHCKKSLKFEDAFKNIKLKKC